MAGNYFATEPPQSVLPPTFVRNVRTWLALVGSVLGIASLAGCGRRPQKQTPPMLAIESAIRPEAFAQSLQKIGRAHLRGTTKFEAGPTGAVADGVTTETDVWLDQRGNWRIVEMNDRDGGREIVRHDRELAIALRYGKMIRRTAEDPEPGQLIGEAVGGPAAAWNLLRGVSSVDDFGEEVRGGRKVHVYKITKARKIPEPPAHPTTTDRRAWRQTLVPGRMEGTVVIDQATGVPLLAEFHARYTMRRPKSQVGSPAPAEPEWESLAGGLDVKTSVEEIGQSPEIARPDAEDAPLRQRTVPEEKALLGGLARAVARNKGTTP